MLLSESPRRTRVRLTKVDLPERHQLRLKELGLRPGKEAIVALKGAFGGLVLNVAGSRIAVDHRSARHIEAEVIA
ncbi:ferrous iron transport protein A [Arcanobacterium haemolyticum]|nr:ferrous iron transport protein A [Arcanobacterium haemolyticum]